MLVLDAYFDETGHGDDANTRFLGIAGVLARAEAWKKVESKWKEALDSEGLPYFHMREYSFSVGPFKSWGKDENRRRKIYGALWDIILEAELIPLGGFVQPNSSDSRSDSVNAPQLTGTNAFPRRELRSWIERAINSLPVPDSPVLFERLTDLGLLAISQNLAVGEKHVTEGS
jgi:hypothetical protein